MQVSIDQKFKHISTYEHGGKYYIWIEGITVEVTVMEYQQMRSLIKLASVQAASETREKG